MLTASLALLSAAVGYAATYITNLNLRRRDEVLGRLDRQLSELYGPLLAYTESNRHLFQAWEHGLRLDGTSPFASDSEPTTEELDQWRLWLSTVFIPNVCRARDVVVQKADLLIEPYMPEVLLELCAHVAAYEITIQQWKDNDKANHLAIIRYPAGLDEYVNSSFQDLKEQQSALLARRAPPLLRARYPAGDRDARAGR